MSALIICKVQDAPPGAVYVGRPMPRYATQRPIAPALLAAVRRGSPLHNPYRPTIGLDAIGAFRQHLWRAIRSAAPAAVELRRLVAIYEQRGGLTLACWCAERPRPPYLLPDGRLDDTPRADRCHADAIAAAVVWWLQQMTEGAMAQLSAS